MRVSRESSRARPWVQNTTRNDPQIFSHATSNGIIGVEWENISISGIRLKRFNSVFRLMRNAKFSGYNSPARNLFKMANRLHKVIFRINCLEFTFSVIMWRSLYQTDGTVVLKCFQFRPSVSLDFLPEDQSDTMSRTAWFTTVILFCFLKSVISARLNIAFHMCQT